MKNIKENILKHLMKKSILQIEKFFGQKRKKMNLKDVFKRFLNWGK